MALMTQERAIETPRPISGRYCQSLSKVRGWEYALLTSIHSSIKELDLRHLDGLSPGLGQTVTLVVSFGGIDWIYLSAKVSLVRGQDMVCT